ncbi:MAG: hypothetical protein ACJZ1R_08270, partial [Candidatus Neomarinimicrobiota bacterium]
MKIRIHFKSLILSLSILSLCFGQTNVSGIISSNTTWTLSNSPYIATGNILLSENTTLTIEPGVIVKFESDLAMQIKGTFIAQGTADNKIMFTSNSSSPSMNDWMEIKFFDESTDATFSGGSYISGSIMEYCIVEYTKYIYISNSRPYITNCEFRFNEVGIEVNNNDSGNQSDLVITNNLFHSNDLGFKSYSTASTGQGGLDFNSNQVYNNTLKGGIDATYGGTYSNNTIKNNIYSDNYGYDAVAGGLYGRPNEVTNNIIIGNSKNESSSGIRVDGVTLHYCNNCNFMDNILNNNSGYVDFYSNTSGPTSIMNNIVVGLTIIETEFSPIGNPITNNIFAGGLDGQLNFSSNNT